MAGGGAGHDDRLLDALSAEDGEQFSGTVWRVTREGRSPLDGSRGSGRWNPSNLSVLYAALDPDGAKAEIYHHITLGQPVFPSKIRHVLHELKVTTENTKMFSSLNELAALGVDPARYKELLYDRTQEIGAAISFLGHDALIAPSARFNCQNLVVFFDNFQIDQIEVVSQHEIDWRAWQTAQATAPRKKSRSPTKRS